MSPHILFVDDEAPIRELLSLYFRKKGCTVTAAVNSKEAKQLMEQNQFSLAILDVDLAGENGLDLLSSIKAKCPQLPVIIFTGLNHDEALLEQALAAGANGFMTKTGSLDALYAEVQRHLPKA